MVFSGHRKTWSHVYDFHRAHLAIIKCFKCCYYIHVNTELWTLEIAIGHKRHPVRIHNVTYYNKLFEFSITDVSVYKKRKSWNLTIKLFFLNIHFLIYIS